MGGSHRRGKRVLAPCSVPLMLLLMTTAGAAHGSVDLILGDVRANRAQMLPWGAGCATGLALPACGLEAASIRRRRDGVGGWLGCGWRRRPPV